MHPHRKKDRGSGSATAKTVYEYPARFRASIGPLRLVLEFTVQRGARRPAETTANKSPDCGVQALVRCKPAAALFTSGLDLSFTFTAGRRDLRPWKGLRFSPEPSVALFY